jgi:hypothetical protein
LVLALALDSDKPPLDAVSPIYINARLRLANTPIHLSVVSVPDAGIDIEAKSLKVLPIRG